MQKDQTAYRLRIVEESIDTHGSALLGYLMGLTGNKHDAEDLFDDLWLFVLRRFKDEHIGEFGLLRRKAYQLFIDRYRRAVRNPVSTVEEVPDKPVIGTAPEAFSEEDEARFKRKFFEDYPVPLSGLHKECLWLHCRIGYTFKEIAGILDIPSSTVGDKVASARKAFADHFNHNK